MSIRTFALCTPGTLAQRGFGFVLDRLRNVRVIRGERHLHDHFAAGRQVDPFHDPEGDDVAAEAGIFHGLQRGGDLLFGQRHGTGNLRNGPRE